MFLQPFSSNVFIVRIWWESHKSPGKAAEWRGVVEHMNTRERIYFRDLEKMSEFITRNANLPPLQRWRRWMALFIGRHL